MVFLVRPVCGLAAGTAADPQTLLDMGFGNDALSAPILAQVHSDDPYRVRRLILELEETPRVAGLWMLAKSLAERGHAAALPVLQEAAREGARLDDAALRAHFFLQLGLDFADLGEPNAAYDSVQKARVWAAGVEGDTLRGILLIHVDVMRMRVDAHLEAKQPS